MPEIIKSGGGVGAPHITYGGGEISLFAVPTPATGTGTSTGSTTLAVTAVTGSIVLGSTVTGTGVPVGTTIVRQTSGPTGGAGSYITSVATTLAGIALTFTVSSTLSYFPEFTPIVPPPVIGVGGGPPPTFPPPTPPPIGAIPPGVTVGPAIAPAGVPPSQAGFPLIQYKTGSATAPTAASWIPQFTTTFPAPTIVIGPFMNSGTGQSGKSPPFVNTPPAQTPSTAPITQSSSWAPQKPPWLFMAPEIAAAAGALEHGVVTGEGLRPGLPPLGAPSEEEEPAPRRPPSRKGRR